MSLPDDHRFSVTYTDAIVRDAVRAFVWRRAVIGQKALWLAALSMALLLAVLLWSGDRSWLAGVVGMACLLPAAMALAAWRAHFANTVGRFRRMADPRADIAFTESGIALASELGRGEIAWSAITEIWERPAAWMIFTGPGQFNVLPFDAIPEPARAWFRDRNRARFGHPA